MPEGEEMFKLHGYSGLCPKPPGRDLSVNFAQTKCPHGNERFCFWCAQDHIRILESEVLRLRAVDDKVKALVEAALKSAIEFVENGIELGFIRMPDADTPDPAHSILDRLRTAPTSLQGEPKA